MINEYLTLQATVSFAALLAVVVIAVLIGGA